MKFVILLVAALGAVPAQAERRQFGNILYDPPRGWSEGREQDGLKLFLPDPAADVCKTCIFYLGKGGPRRGSIEAFMRENAASFVDADEASDIEFTGGANPTRLAGHDAAMLPFRVGSDIYILTAFELSDRFEIVAFKTSGRTDARIEEALETTNTVITPVLEGMEFVSEGAEPLLPEAEPGDLSGIYRGYAMRVAVGAGGMGTLAPSYRTLVFWPDGHFYDGTPPQGLSPLDRGALLTSGAADFGVYRQRRGRVDLTYADGRTEVMEREGDGWMLGDRELTPAAPLDDGARIDGTLSIRQFGGFTVGSGLSGGTLASSVTRFYPDGTFGASTVVGSAGGFDSGGGFGGSSSDSREGRYEIRDGLLILHPDDGSVPARKLIFRQQGQIVIGNTVLDE